MACRLEAGVRITPLGDKTITGPVVVQWRLPDHLAQDHVSRELSLCLGWRTWSGGSAVARALDTD